MAERRLVDRPSRRLGRRDPPLDVGDPDRIPLGMWSSMCHSLYERCSFGPVIQKEKNPILNLSVFIARRS
jgi:hypothetical protein